MMECLDSVKNASFFFILTKDFSLERTEKKKQIQILFKIWENDNKKGKMLKI
jgi:hypothetical protein